jgi:hypothetical protein
MSRDIPALSTIILKEIAKTPGKYVTEAGFARANRMPTRGFDLAQVIVDYVIEAGRLIDDAVPVCIFANRTSVSLKNSKISPVYINKVIARCPNLVNLDLSGTFLVDDECVQMIFRQCPMIENIGIQNCRKLSDLCLQTIAASGSKVTGLQLGGNFNITMDGLLTQGRSVTIRAQRKEVLNDTPAGRPTILSLF